MKLPAGPSGALDDDDAASLEASLLEDVALDDETPAADHDAAADGADVWSPSAGFACVGGGGARRDAVRLLHAPIAIAGGVRAG